MLVCDHFWIILIDLLLINYEIWIAVSAIYIFAVLSLQVEGVELSYCGHFSGSTDGKIYFPLMFIVYFCAPLVIITVSYAKIFNVLNTRSRDLDCNRSVGELRSIHTRQKLAKMMVSVSVLFAACWGPHFCFHLWLFCGGKVKRNGFFAASVIEFLPLISSALNPFIYTINSKTFQVSWV